MKRVALLLGMVLFVGLGASPALCAELTPSRSGELSAQQTARPNPTAELTPVGAGELSAQQTARPNALVNITIAELADASSELDGQAVVFTGEAVGDIINAGADFRWLTVDDASSSISVYVTAEDAAKIVHLGRYNQIGTTLLIEGIFDIDCDLHDGLSDVHATAVTVVDPGADVTTAFNTHQFLVGVLLILIAVGLFVLHWRLRERSR
jgi:hypothetical protein